ncbi:MAG: flagellar motor switch protein FliM [Candidatus Gastranaerophilales bacterium]|nr:flagellar motor switch protein FliM [Candidatus Gastranaerophilales bacterium]
MNKNKTKNNYNNGKKEEFLYKSSDNDIDISEEYKKGYKLYNFRRPDKFSKEHLRGLQDIHREFARQLEMNLTAYLSLPIEIDVVSVDQLTYDEFTHSMPESIAIGLLELTPLPNQVLLGINFEILSSIVDRMLGGVGICEDMSHEMTDIEESLAKQFIKRTVNTLETSWAHVVPVKGTVDALATNYQNVQVASPGEIVALITFEIQIASKYFGLMSLCYPYPVLENILGHLSTQRIFHTKGIVATTEERQKMIEKLNTSNIDISVLFGTTDITAQDFLDLKVGDVIRLDNKVTDDLIVKINGEKKFFACPGTLKDKICVKIDERYNEVIDILKAYL